MDAIAGLLALVEDDPETPESLREIERKTHPDAIRTHLVAETVAPKSGSEAPTNGRVVGWAFAERDPWDPPGRFVVGVIVNPDYRRRGIGERLYEHVATDAQTRGATRLRSDLRDNQAEGIHFAERHGFHAERHVFDSVLDLTSFDPSHFAGAITSAEAAGFRFASLAELGDTPAHRRHLYDLHVETGRDIPGTSGTWEPYDVYAQGFFGRDSYRPDGQWVVLDTRAVNRRLGFVRHSGYFKMYRDVR